MDASQEFSLPAPEPSDSDEVRQALESANQLWPEDPREALRCLRRAAEGAADAGDDLRSVQLARQAADLRTAANLAASMPPPAVSPVPVAPRALSQDPAQTVPATPAASAAAQTGVTRSTNGAASPVEEASAAGSAPAEALTSNLPAEEEQAEAPAGDAAQQEPQVDRAAASSAGANGASADVTTDDAAWDVRTSEDAGQGPVSSGPVEQETPQAPVALGGGAGSESGAMASEGAALAAASGEGASASAQPSVPATLEQSAPWANGEPDPRAELPTSPGATSELATAAPSGAPAHASGTYHAVASGAPEADSAGPQSGRGLGRFAAPRGGDEAPGATPARFQGGLQPRLRAARAQATASTNGAAGVASAFRSGVQTPGDGAAGSKPPLASDSGQEAAPYSAPGRFVQHRAVRVSISPFPNASGHFELHPLAEGEPPEPGWKVAVLVALDTQERLFPGRG